MRRRWKKKSLYISTFVKDSYDEEDNIISIYKKAEFIGEENIQPLSGTSDTEMYGTKVTKMQKVLLDYDKYLDKFSENDLAYIGVEDIFIKQEENNGDNANYRIDSVRPQNKKIAIYFEKLPNK